MASPNIVNVSSIVGLTTYYNLSNTDEQVFLSNPGGSGKVYKVNNIIISNVDGTSSAAITIKYRSASSGGGTAFPIASTVDVAADSTLVAIDKSTAIYMEENTSITLQASAANDLCGVASYEIIS